MTTPEIYCDENGPQLPCTFCGEDYGYCTEDCAAPHSESCECPPCDRAFSAECQAAAVENLKVLKALNDPCWKHVVALTPDCEANVQRINMAMACVDMGIK